MHTLTAVYNTDIWHTHTSKQPIGVFTDKQAAIDALTQRYAISEQQKINLWLFNQTQSTSDEEPAYDGEFVLEDCPLNTITA
jgi:hypothetical protein